MKYIQACGLEEHEVYFFEVDGQMAAYRQVSVVNGHCRVSVAPDFHLIETEVELFEGDEEITREAFEEIWQQAVLPYREAWEKAKSLCPPGKTSPVPFECSIRRASSSNWTKALMPLRTIPG